MRSYHHCTQLPRLWCLWLAVVACFAVAAGPAEAKSAKASFPGSTPRSYVSGSGRDLPFNTSGDTAGVEVEVTAWSNGRSSRVGSFTHTIDQAPWVIDDSKLDLLPVGTNLLSLTVKKDGRTISKVTRWIRVSGGSGGGGGSGNDPSPNPDPNDGGEKPLPTIAFNASTPTTYVKGSGVSIPFTVTGDLPSKFDLLVLAHPGSARTVINTFTIQLSSGPWVIPAAKLDLLPEGTITLELLGRKNYKGFREVSHQITIVEGNGNDPGNGGGNETPEIELGFASGTPTTYVKGSGIPITLNVDGELPSSFDLLALAHPGSSSSVVNSFTTQMRSGPWVIPASKFDSLAPGTYRIELLARKDYKGFREVFHQITVVGGSGNDPGNGGNDPGNGGNDPGNGGNDPGNGGNDPGNGGNDPGEDPTDPTEPDPTIPGRSKFRGINLNKLEYFGTDWAFANVFLQTRAMNDIDGYKQHTAFIEGKAPKGTYKASWRGSGDVKFDKGLHETKRYKDGDVTRCELSYDGSKMWILTKGDVRDLKVMMPGVPENQKFHPLYLERLRPFQVIRFMDWQRTNGSGQTKWSDRAQPDGPQGNNAGVAFEHIIDLCNELKADAWVCVPHKADDDYIRRMAEMFRDRLWSGGKVYLEWSNETWNFAGGFSQTRWLHDKAAANGRDGSEQRAIEFRRAFKIWHDTWGSKKDRVLRVVAMQEYDPGKTRSVLANMDGEFDILSTSAYVSVKTAELSDSSSVDNIIDKLYAKLRGDAKRVRTEQGEIAREYSKKLGRHIPYVAYEAGQHLTSSGRDTVWARTMKKAQKSPRMYDFYLENQKIFEQAGGSMIAHFNFVEAHSDKFGSWGHLEYMDQPIEDAPKFKAILDYPDSKVRAQLINFD